MPEGTDRLTAAARELLAAARAFYERDRCPAMGVNHWLAVLWRRHADLMATLSPAASAARDGVLAALQAGDSAQPASEPEIVGRASARAGRQQRSTVDVGDLAAAVLEQAGFAVADESIVAQARDQAEQRVPVRPARQRPGRSATGHQPAPNGALRSFACDLTEQARLGQLPPVVGRDAEIDLVIEILCRRSKGNPVLVGPAGVGKTAIAEGLAQRFVDGSVPELLRDRPLLSIPASSLSAGAGIVGELAKRVQAVLREAEACRAILFMDELHTVVGAGAASSHPTGDVANLLKPALARGAISLIGATTDGEYRRYLEADPAFERRLQPVRINEPTLAQTWLILTRVRDHLAESSHITVGDDVLRWIVDFSARTMANRFFPDKAIDLLEQTVAHALAQGEAATSLATATVVAERLVGMPAEPAARLGDLTAKLVAQALLTANEADDLADRLQVTLRGLDLTPGRPNAVVLAVQAAAAEAERLAAVIAEELFGAPERVVRIETARLDNEAGLNALIGAAAGYVGYEDTLPLHRVSQIPWCVLLLPAVDLAPPVVQAWLAESLATGYVTLATGKRVYLSDAVVLLTAGEATRPGGQLGFRDRGPQAETTAAADLPPGLVNEVDVVVAGLAAGGQAAHAVIAEVWLPLLAERYANQRLTVEWDAPLVDWLAKQCAEAGSPRSNARLLEEQLSPLLLNHLPAPSSPAAKVRLTLNALGQPAVLQEH